jgi:nucleotide-binding universal stress UspA family protein
MLPLQKVLWPTDFSPASYAALEPAKELAQQFGAELFILHVIPLVSSVLAQHVDIEDYQEKQRRFALGEMSRIINKHIGDDIMVQKAVINGNPVNGIVRFSEKEHINVIVIATHGESALHNFFFGSVAEKVIRFSTRPVLVIRSPKSE